MNSIIDKISSPTFLKNLVRVLWIGIIGGFIFLFLLFFTISKKDLPTFTELENPDYDFASLIYDDAGVVYGKYYVENREEVSYDSLSVEIKNALLSTEDVRFFSHSGIDLKALLRVGLKSVLLQKESSGGGSTISQQLAKLLFRRPSMAGMGKIKRTLLLVETKLKEWITAVKLEKRYTKEEIIAMYLNKFEFINGAHGIQAASQTYFDKNQKDLKTEEAAVLVGMLQNPSLYNPIRFPEKSKVRRNVVLHQLQSENYLSASSRDSLSTLEVDVSGFNRRTQSEGPAPYFRSELTKWLRNLFKEKNILKSDGTEYNIYTDGLKIHTTIDLDYQRLAEQALEEHMAKNQQRYFKVWKNRDPWKYDADPDQRKIRKESLNRKFKGSERYLSLREKHLGEVVEKIRTKQANLPLSDNVIETLQDIKDGKTSFSRAISENLIDESYIEKYKSLISGEDFSRLSTKYKALEDKYNKVFSKEVVMEVFNHDINKVDTVTMSPFDSVRYHSQHLQSGLLAVDPSSGYIKAWVGGINHKYFKYDHVNSRRQVGSTIKPFVYTCAIALQGINPCQEFDDIQYTIAPGDANFDVDKEWSPANANGEFTGNRYNLFHGLLYSKNSITVRLVKEMGNVEVIRSLLRNAGIDVDFMLPGDHVVVPNVPSISLGAVDLSLLEMTGAYTTFANNGMYTEPVFIKKIEDKNGKVIYAGIPERKMVINPVYNSVMVEMLRNNVAGKYGMGLKTPVGGKTGTTNDYSDGWFMAITPELVVGTWVGGDDQWIRFTTLNDGQGYVMARPIVQKFLKKLEKEDVGFNSDAKFRNPPYEYFDLVDCERYKQVLPEEEQEQILQQKQKKDEFEDEFDEEFNEGF